MEIKPTGVSTPSIGESWEYAEKNDKLPNSGKFCVKKKLNVFISSNIGDLYESVRQELKEKIEDTGLANVYTFESNGSSTSTAHQEYISELEDSDVCIFLIDNYDGVNAGTQKEIDHAKKHNIKSLYYFCDERSKTKTSVEESLLGENYSKISHVHNFSDFCDSSFNDLMKDIIFIYHNYCIGRLNYTEFEDSQKLGLPASNIGLTEIPKSVLKEVDECKATIKAFVLNKKDSFDDNDIQSTNAIDDWCNNFLNVLLSGKKINDINSSIFFDILKGYQEDEAFFNLTKMRWKAVQYYFLGNINRCIESAQEALEYAKETDQPSWIIKDILLDIRNQKHLANISKNILFSKSEEQKELMESNEQLYYPVMDRIISSLGQQYIDNLYQSKIDSPFTVSLGSNFDYCVELIASAYVIAMYHGSLTHILMLYDRLKELLFYLSSRFDNWELKLSLLKLEVFDGNSEKVKRVLDTFPILLNQMNSHEALSIISFSNNHPIEFKRQLGLNVGFGCIGYYLNDSDFASYYDQFKKSINSWLNTDKRMLELGNSIMYALDGVAYRISQNDLALFCCDIIERHYNRWLNKLFKIISSHVDLNRLDEETSCKLIEVIENCFNDEQDRQEIMHNAYFLINMRKQSKQKTEKLDKLIEEYFPTFYENRYTLEFTDDKSFFTGYITQMISTIKKDNEEQGKNGCYYGTATDHFETIISILSQMKIDLSEDITNEIITTSIETLLYSKQSIPVKNSAAILLILIFKNYADSSKYSNQIDELMSNRDNINFGDSLVMSSNISSTSLKISIDLLLSYLGKDVYSDLIKLFSLLKNDTATIISVSYDINAILEIMDDESFDTSISIIIVQNVLNWLRNDYMNIRWHALNIMMALSRNGNYDSIVNGEVINLIDHDNLYIKNRVLHLLDYRAISSDTKKYVMTKCLVDDNYLVRKVAREIKMSD